MPPSKAKQLGKIVRDARTAKGVSYRTLAESIGVHHTTIARLENGEVESPAVTMLQALSRALEIPLEDLYALAGYARTEVLPSLPVYLRSKYNLSAGDVAELEEHFARLKNKRKTKKKE